MGLIAAVLSATLAASKDLVSKQLSVRLDGTASTFASFAFALPFYILVLGVLLLMGKEVLTFSLVFLGLVVLRSVTDSLAEGMKMHALSHGDISVVATFLSLSPVFLLIASPLITGDKPSLPGACAVILVVCGSLLLVYRPSQMQGTTQTKGILLGIGASVFFSLNSCFDRLAVQKGTPAFAGFTMTLLSAIILAPLIIRRKDRLEGLVAQQRGLWARGLLEVGFMVAKLYALQFLQAPYVAGIQRLSLVLSIIGGRIFFREEDFGRRLAAGVLILVGVFLIAWLQLS